MRAPRAATMPQLISGEELASMEDIGPCELIDGMIIKISPNRLGDGIVEIELAVELGKFIKKHNLGRVMTGEVGIYTRRNPDTVRGADIVFISHKRLAKRGPHAFLDVAPELIVQIKSPENTWPKLRKKVKEYFNIGVDWVWIVEPKRKTVFAYLSPTSCEKYEQEDSLFGEGILEGFSLRVAEVFS